MTPPAPDVHLVPELVGPALDELTRQRQELDGKWLDATAAIRLGESGFALSDTLQRAFLEGYAPKAEEVSARAGRRQEQYGLLVAAGRDSVEIYRRGDGASAQKFPDAE